jgi:hypothetical protein
MRQRWLVFGSIVMAGLSFFGLSYMVQHLWPDPYFVSAKLHLLFLAIMFVGLSTGTIPVSAYLNHRFSKPGWPERDKARLARQGAWVGFFGVLLAYLQLMRALNWTIVAVLAGVFILIETFFLTRE